MENEADAGVMEKQSVNCSFRNQSSYWIVDGDLWKIGLRVWLWNPHNKWIYGVVNKLTYWGSHLHTKHKTTIFSYLFSHNLSVYLFFLHIPRKHNRRILIHLAIATSESTLDTVQHSGHLFSRITFHLAFIYIFCVVSMLVR